MSAKHLATWLGLIGTILIGWLFIDGRYFHSDDAEKLSEKIIFKDTARQIDITDLKIRQKAAKPALSPEEETELDSLKLQQRILYEQLKDLEKKQ